MSQTPRLRLPYPDNRARDWFDTFESFASGVDAALFARTEDAALVLAGSGDIAWDSTLGSLVWSAALVLHSPLTGFAWSIPAGSATLVDRAVLMVTVDRGPVSAVTVSAVVAGQVSDFTNQIPIAVRVGSAVHFRNGAVIAASRSVSWADLVSPLEEDIVAALRAANSPAEDNPYATMDDIPSGLSSDITNALTGAASPSASNVFATMGDLPSVPSVVGLVNEITVLCGAMTSGADLGATLLVGSYRFVPSEHAGVTAVSFRVEGYTSGGGSYAGTVTLYDPVALATLATVTLNTTTLDMQEAALSAVPGTARTLEVRMTSPTGTAADWAKALRGSLRFA